MGNENRRKVMALLAVAQFVTLVVGGIGVVRLAVQKHDLERQNNVLEERVQKLEVELANDRRLLHALIEENEALKKAPRR